MSTCYAGIFYSHRLVVVSSDNDILDYNNLPLSDPPEYDEDDEPMLDPPEDDEDDQPMLADTLDSDRNPLLTSDDIPFNHTIFPPPLMFYWHQYCVVKTTSRGIFEVHPSQHPFRQEQSWRLVTMTLCSLQTLRGNISEVS